MWVPILSSRWYECYYVRRVDGRIKGSRYSVGRGKPSFRLREATGDGRRRGTRRRPLRGGGGEGEGDRRGSQVRSGSYRGIVVSLPIASKCLVHLLFVQYIYIYIFRSRSTYVPNISTTSHTGGRKRNQPTRPGAPGPDPRKGRPRPPFPTCFISREDSSHGCGVRSAMGDLLQCGYSQQIQAFLNPPAVAEAPRR